MAQFDFIGTVSDSWQILTAILEREDVAFIPDIHYDAPEPLFLTGVDGRLKNMNTMVERPRFFIWSRQWSRFPPCLQPHPAKEKEGKYYVDFAKGGPLLDLSLPPCYEEGGILNLACGTLSYQRLYFNPNTKVWEKASTEVKAGYKDIRSRIKKTLVSHRVRNVDIWMGHEAMDLVNAGKARVRGFGLEKNGT